MIRHVAQRSSASLGTALSVVGGVPPKPGWPHGGDILKGSLHSPGLCLDQMTFQVLSNTWGFMLLFLLCIDAGHVSHHLNQRLNGQEHSLEC